MSFHHHNYRTHNLCLHRLRITETYRVLRNMVGDILMKTLIHYLLNHFTMYYKKIGSAGGSTNIDVSCLTTAFLICNSICRSRINSSAVSLISASPLAIASLSAIEYAKFFSYFTYIQGGPLCLYTRKRVPFDSKSG